MVARTDLRPTRADDSLKKLLGKVANPQTVPHGVKVAQPGEYVSFYDTDGSAHRWDGDAIAEYDTRIAEGTAAVAATQAHLAEVEADLEEAKERITASNGDLTLYVERVEAAQAAADSANAALQNLTSELETAQSAVDAVANRTGAVESALADTDTKAAQAASDANAAKDAAQNALAAAQQVQADAQNALSKAEEAEAKALEAAGIAAGKGKIIHSASEPSGAEALTTNLWVRSSDSKLHRWDGTRWVEVTDKAILDAASAAAAAQSTASKAVADAAAAASTAQAANVAAGNAQRTADGKTVALYGTVTPPPAPGVTQGDLYYRTGTDNRIIEHWQWSGSQWVKRAIESAQLVNFDAGYITSGYLDVAKRIRAGDIHADKLFVGIGDNLMPPLSMAADYGGAHPYRVLTATGGYTGGVSITVPASTSQIGAYLSGTTSGDYLIKVNPGGSYRVSAWVKPGTKVGRPTLYIQLVNSTTGAWVWANPQSVTGTNLTAGVWSSISGVVAAPAGAYDRMRVGIFVEGGNDATIFSDLTVREPTDGELIVNGTITGEKINAESVAAAVGSFVKVNAENVTVTGELAARVVNAMDAQVKNLVVTESAILQHTTLLGETVAEQLNVTKKLVARDAIVNGTLDVEQLNVTEGMSAQIVSAMSVESKKLVVTDEAILNKATVVQSLVTPELVAQKISSALITGSTIQTSATANQGVKIDSSGYKAYDSNGNLAVNLDGKDNRVVGSFATAYNDASGVKITQKATAAAIDLYTPNWGGNASYRDSHAGIWFEVPSNLSNRKLNIIATDKKDSTRDDPGMLLWPGAGIGFQGRFISDSPAWKMGKLTSTSLAPGASADWDITFPTAMTGQQPAIFPMVTNGANAVVSYVVTQQSNSGFHLRVKNTDTFATGSVMVIWWAVGTSILNV